MKGIIFIIVLIFAVIGISGCNSPILTVDQLEKNPDQYINQIVTVEGTVVKTDVVPDGVHVPLEGAAVGTNLWLCSTSGKSEVISAWYSRYSTRNIENRTVKIIGKLVKNPVFNPAQQYYLYSPAANYVIIVDELEVIG